MSLKLFLEYKKKFALITFLFTFTLFPCSPVVFAGGGRMVVQNSSGLAGLTTTYVGVTATVEKPAEQGGGTSVGEKVEFRVQNPRAGDRCETYGDGTSTAGWVGGTCYAQEAGTIIVYLHSLDYNDDSTGITLYFYAPSPTPTLIPTNTPTPKPALTAIPTPSKTPTPTAKLSSSTTIFLSPTTNPTPTATPSATPKPTKPKSESSSVLWIVLGILFFGGAGAAGFVFWKKPWLAKHFTELPRKFFKKDDPV